MNIKLNSQALLFINKLPSEKKKKRKEVCVCVCVWRSVAQVSLYAIHMMTP